jgi:hypothetical protein
LLVWPCHLVICIMVGDGLLILWLIMLIIYAYDYSYITVAWAHICHVVRFSLVGCTSF